MSETLIQGISVMLIGMGTVVTFLCVTIVSMFIMSAIVGKLNKLFPETAPAVVGAKRNTASNDDNEVAVAIISAMFRK
ncbi:OadG family protein [bacterium]|nr:OadG family protein [bacterium]